VAATPRTVTIVGAPLDLGQGRRGVDMGPSAIRYAGLEERLASFGCAVVDRGNVLAPEPEALAVEDERARFLPEILDACAGSRRSWRSRSRAARCRSCSAATIRLRSGRSRPPGRGGPAGWRHLDRRARRPQHADLEPERERPRHAPRRGLGRAGDAFSPSRPDLPAVDPGRVVLLGVRSLDPAERAMIRETGIRAITMTEIDRIGIERAITEAIDRVSGPGFVHVSLDLDALDPEVAPGVGTPVKGGLTYREAHLACEDLAESGAVGSLELVEVNPILDRENGSAAIAVELAASALGQSIL
jgi:arginase